MNNEVKSIMPMLFLGHGSPMNAIENNCYTAGFKLISKELPVPKAILCISAHWETEGTYVTAMDKPKTIHDFGGFPEPLYQFKYPAPGSPLLAGRIHEMVKSTNIGLDYDWGFDHGCWVVTKFIYPKANIPIVELSIDYTQPAAYHYKLAKQLAALRAEGILIIASGNIVHNLRKIDWDHLEDSGYGYDWAIAFNDKIKRLIQEGEHQQIINIDKSDLNYRYAVPSPDHFLPLLYILALQTKDDKLRFFNDSLVGGSLSMTSLLLKQQ